MSNYSMPEFISSLLSIEASFFTYQKMLPSFTISSLNDVTIFINYRKEEGGVVKLFLRTTF